MSVSEKIVMTCRQSCERLIFFLLASIQKLVGDPDGRETDE